MSGRPGTETQAQLPPRLAPTSYFLEVWQRGEISNLEGASLLFLTALAWGPALAGSPRKTGPGPRGSLPFRLLLQRNEPPAASGGAVWDQKPASLGLPPPPRGRVPQHVRGSGHGGALGSPGQAGALLGKAGEGPGTPLSGLGP